MSTSRQRLLPNMDNCPCSGVTLAKLVQPTIMMILAGGELHGYRIVERAARTPIFAGKRPDPTGVYRVLRNMEKRGLVTASWDLSDRGPAKRSYRLTAAGRKCATRWEETLAEYHRAIAALLSARRRAPMKLGLKGRARRSETK